jgi:predicted branched-subunit amino acid permease
VPLNLHLLKIFGFFINRRVTFYSFLYKPQIHKQKLQKMKKLLLVLAIGAFAACNNGENTTTTDSTTVDSSTMMGTDTMGTGTGTTDTLGTGTGSGQ